MIFQRTYIHTVHSKLGINQPSLKINSYILGQTDFVCFRYVCNKDTSTLLLQETNEENLQVGICHLL